MEFAIRRKNLLVIKTNSSKLSLGLNKINEIFNCFEIHWQHYQFNIYINLKNAHQMFLLH